MTRLSHRQRLESALEGLAQSPPVAGVTFVPADALGGTAGQGRSPAQVLADFVEDAELDFAFVPADADWAGDAVRLLRRSGRGAFWAVDGPLWPVLRERGPGEGLKATAWNPEDLEHALDAHTASAQDLVLAGADMSVDAIVVCDDVAGAAGPLVSPDFFNEYLVPRYATLVATAAGMGTRAVFHSDGDIRVFMPALARAGFISVHPGGGVTQEVFEKILGEAKSHGMTLIGGIDSRLLSEGPAVAVRLGTRAAVMASAGGLIIADDGGMTTSEEVNSFVTALGSAGVGK